MIEKFDKPEHDAGFRRWMAEHPDGYYVNKTGASQGMLHRVGCPHLGTGEGVICTTNSKLCSDSAEELKREMRGMAWQLSVCSQAICRAS